VARIQGAENDAFGPRAKHARCYLHTWLPIAAQKAKQCARSSPHNSARREDALRLNSSQSRFAVYWA
jgi:hypothetical protein